MSFFGIPIRNGLSLGLGTVASLTNGPGFLPSELFYNGTVQGAWYDPSDLTTLFQDSAGTTPVTAVEQAVGLMLDKSKGLVLGSDVVINGDFSSSANWTLSSGGGGSATISGGLLTLSGGNTTFPSATQSSVLTSGRWYRITVVTTASVTLASVGIRIGGSTNNFPFVSAAGTYTATVLADGANIVFIRNSGYTDTAVIDSISVRELPGNHAYQSTSASRPTLRARYNLLTYSEQFDNAVWLAIGAKNVTPNTDIAPDGTLTADTLADNSAAAFQGVGQAATVPVNSATYTFSLYIKKTSGGTSATFGINFTISGGTTVTNQPRFNTDTGAVLAGTATVENAGNYWRVSVPLTNNNTAGNVNITVNLFPATSAYNVSFPDSAAATGSAVIWGAQLTTPAVFPSNTYQRIGAATDYATGAAFPPYLFFDGTDDSMLTNSVDFATVTSDGQARRNLLLNPTQFDASTWTAVATTVTANSTTAPDSSATADTITENTANTLHSAAQFGLTVSASTAYTLSTYVKANGRNFVNIRVNDNATNANAASMLVNVQTGSVTGIATAYGTFTAVSGSVVDAGSGWYRLILSFTTSTAAIAIKFELSNGAARSADGQAAAYLGDGTSGVFIWGAQLETGSTATAFQNIGTDRMLVVAGVTKQSDAARGMLVELSANALSNAGTIWVQAPSAAAATNYQFLSGGTTSVSVTGTATAPVTNVVSGIGNIAAPVVTLRINGAQAATYATTQGTGNFGNYPLYIGRRNNASLPFNGNLYSLIIAGQSYSSGQISSTESWVAAKTPLGTI